MSAVEHEPDGDVIAARIDRDVALRNRGITRVRQASPGTKNKTRRYTTKGGGNEHADTHRTQNWGGQQFVFWYDCLVSKKDNKIKIRRCR